MSSDYSRGRLTNLLFYFFESITIILYTLVKAPFPTALTIGIILYLILTCIFLIEAPVRIPMKMSHYSRIQITLLMILALMLCYTFKSGHIFLYSMYLRILITFLYTDEQLCRFQSRITLLFTIGLWIADFPGISSKPTTTEMILDFLSIYTASWILTNLARIRAFEYRKGIEQERSLDDLLKVVETKCDEAQRATRIKSEFLSNMSHEIRTPINTILGMNEMILRETTDSDIHKYAGNVENAGKMLLSLINDILDFSKIESGKMMIIPVKYQVSSVLNDLINMLKPKADAKELTLALEVNPNIPNLLTGDEVRIRQIATNLLTNAIKYTASGTITLIVDFKQIDTDTISFYLAVKDTGIGIREEDIPKLFSSFQRVNEKQNRNIEGTGLGLSITNHLVKLMDGTIGVESTYGEGSLFHVTIPQKVADSKPIGTFNHHPERTDSHFYRVSFTAPKACILIVDDNSMNLAVAEGLLKQTLIQIETASSGEECLRMLRQKNYHLLLLDHMMPNLDGVETLSLIKTEHLADTIPVIALTANAVSGAREMYLDYGFQDYLSKPIAGSSLEKILYRWLPQELIIPSPPATTDSAEVDDTKVIFQETDDNYTDSPEHSSDLLSIDHDAALEYCANDEALYHQVLSFYIEQGEEYIKNLEEFYAEHNWEQYCTISHAVKSTSKTIGAVAFSTVAASLEQAARIKDEAILLAKHAYFLEQYKLLLEKIKEML